MRTRPKLDLWLLTLFVIQPALCYADLDQLPDPQAAEHKLVEIEYAPQILLPYRERRQSWGFLFGLHYENFQPSAYLSPIDQNPYDYLFGGSGVGMFGLQMGAKYNLSSFSLTSELSYDQGSTSSAQSGAQTSLTLSRIAAKFGIWFDTLWSEPYVVPYLQGDISQISFSETTGTQSTSGTGGITYGWAAGVLLQLNWLDKVSALEALRSSGLNNAYLDIYAAQTNGSGSASADLSSSVSWGSGLRMEF